MKYLITKFKIYSTSNNIFENVNDQELKIGDYVLCDEISVNKDVYSFTKNTIGKLVFIMEKGTHAPYVIKYDNVPILDVDYFVNEKGRDQGDKQERKYRRMRHEEIKYWSPDKEDLETYIDVKKYNL